MTTCKICKKEMAADEDLGGDCRACVGECGDLAAIAGELRAIAAKLGNATSMGCIHLWEIAAKVRRQAKGVELAVEGQNRAAEIGRVSPALHPSLRTTTKARGSAGDALLSALDDIARARSRHGATGFPVGLYSPDPATWMENRAQAAIDAHSPQPASVAGKMPSEEAKDALRYRYLRERHSFYYPQDVVNPSPAECGIQWAWQQTRPDEPLDIDRIIDSDIAALDEEDRAALAAALAPAGENGVRAEVYEACAMIAESFGKPYELHASTGPMMFRAVVDKIAAAIRQAAHSHLASPPAEWTPLNDARSSLIAGIQAEMTRNASHFAFDRIGAQIVLDALIEAASRTVSPAEPHDAARGEDER